MAADSHRQVSIELPGPVFHAVLSHTQPLGQFITLDVSQGKLSFFSGNPNNYALALIDLETLTISPPLGAKETLTLSLLPGMLKTLPKWTKDTGVVVYLSTSLPMQEGVEQSTTEPLHVEVVLPSVEIVDPADGESQPVNTGKSFEVEMECTVLPNPTEIPDLEERIKDKLNCKFECPKLDLHPTRTNQNTIILALRPAGEQRILMQVEESHEEQSNVNMPSTLYTMPRDSVEVYIDHQLQPDGIPKGMVPQISLNPTIAALVQQMAHKSHATRGASFAFILAHDPERASDTSDAGGIFGGDTMQEDADDSHKSLLLCEETSVLAGGLTVRYKLVASDAEVVDQNSTQRLPELSTPSKESSARLHQTRTLEEHQRLTGAHPAKGRGKSAPKKSFEEEVSSSSENESDSDSDEEDRVEKPPKKKKKKPTKRMFAESSDSDLEEEPTTKRKKSATISDSDSD